MRAVAHGLLGDKNYVECPSRCGGPGADRSRLGPETLELRDRVGCDSPCEPAWYAILCPTCNGTRTVGDGECPEDDCMDDGQYRGYKKMRRCPGSFQTPDVSAALHAAANVRKHGAWPVEGGTMDQAATFLGFMSELDAAVDVAQKGEDD